MLERGQKRCSSQRSDEPEAGPSKFTRCSVDTVPDIKIIFFLCEKMSLGQTETPWQRIYMKDLMIVLEDKKLIAKSSAGDLVAQEA